MERRFRCFLLPQWKERMGSRREGSELLAAAPSVSEEAQRTREVLGSWEGE